MILCVGAQTPSHRRPPSPSLPKFDCESKNYSEFDSESLITGRDGKTRFHAASTQALNCCFWRRSPPLLAWAFDKRMSCRMPRQFESIFLNALISIADTRCCPLPLRGVRKRACSERSCYKSRPSSQNAVELNGGFMRRRAGAQDASSCTTCVYPDALRPQSANERHLDDLCLPNVWLSPSEHSLKGKVRTFPWLFSSDKPFNQNYFTQTQNMWGTDSEESYCQM